MHKAKLKTKILSLLLAVSMVAGNIPETTITAIAAEAGNHAPKISAADCLTIKKNVIIKLPNTVS